MQEDFKMNVYFDDKGENIENLLAHYIISVLNQNNEIYKYHP